MMRIQNHDKIKNWIIEPNINDFLSKKYNNICAFRQ